MNAVIVRLHEKFLIEFHAAIWPGIEFHHPASDARRIELLVPCDVEGIGEIHALAVPTDFDHLWATTQRLVGFGRMWRLLNNPADVNRGRFLWMERVGYIVLDKFPCAPAGDV